MFTPQRAVIFLASVAALPLVANAQPPQTTSVTTTTTRSAPSPDLNTDTNSLPDMSGSAQHPFTDVRIRPGVGLLTVSMANFSVRTGLEIRANTNAQVAVATVRPESPSARAGVEAGDIISKVNGIEVPSIGAFQKLLMQKPAQAAFFLTLKRSDRSFRVAVGRQLPLMGMTVFPDAADRPVVADLDPSSPAGYAGFQVGDMIIGVGHQMAVTMDRLLDVGVPFIRSGQAGQGISFLIARDGKLIQLSVTRPADAELPPLTPDQERHLRRLGMAATGENPRRVISTTTTNVTRTTGGLLDPVTRLPVPAPPAMPPFVGTYTTGYGASVVGSDALGLALPPGDAPGIGDAAPIDANPSGFGPLRNANGAVAVLYGHPSNVVQQAMMPAPQSTVVSTVSATAPGLHAGVVGFVQIQTDLASTNARAKAAPQSLVSARVAGVPAGIYNLVVNQYGDCGDIASASAGPPAVTLGKMVVDANGLGLLPPQIVNHTPQAFLGRVVSLIPAGVVPPTNPAPGQPAASPGTVQANASSVACGVFGVANPRRPFIGANLPPAGPSSSGAPVTTAPPATRGPVPPPPVPSSPNR